ncbi:Ankyrin repeat and LEM domain-containing protein, partial [Operophtera brumata]
MMCRVGFRRAYRPKQCVSSNTENNSRSVCETAMSLHYYGPKKCNQTIPAEDKQRLRDCLDRRAWNWLSSGSIIPRSPTGFFIINPINPEKVSDLYRIKKLLSTPEDGIAETGTLDNVDFSNAVVLFLAATPTHINTIIPCKGISVLHLAVDKIVVTTDEVVAEYELINQEATANTTYRKSEIVRNWCENNSLVVNKLYPTILGETCFNPSILAETCLLENESEPWDENITLDLTTDTFKTCLSKRAEVEISGIHPLEATSKCTCDNNIRQSVYENFSIAGSPKLISHKNYNSKCSLRSKFVNHKIKLINDSLISSDRSFDNRLTHYHNKLTVEEYKKTNGKLSDEFNKQKIDEYHRTNGKFYKAMAVVQNSGVSSNYSGGSIVIASVHEEYKYQDRAEGVLLIEKRLLVSPVILELKKSLRSEVWMDNLTPYIELDKKVRADFTDPNKNWREGKSKTSFTYLLLDPRTTDNLPAKQSHTKIELWLTFVNSIFYVGKALTLWKSGFTTSNDKKIQHILDIWRSKVGVVCLHIFQNVIPAEAYTYEAAMIDVIGLSTLKNLKCGTYYGVAASWPLKERRMLGLYL